MAPRRKVSCIPPLKPISMPVLLSRLDALCRQPLSNISGPPVPQSAAPLQAAHAQQSSQRSTQPQQQQHQHQQHATQQPAQQPQQQQKQQHGAQGQQQQRVRREDENSVVVRGTRYTKLECVGRGGSSKVTSPSLHTRGTAQSPSHHADNVALTLLHHPDHEAKMHRQVPFEGGIYGEDSSVSLFNAHGLSFPQHTIGLCKALHGRASLPNGLWRLALIICPTCAN